MATVLSSFLHYFTMRKNLIRSSTLGVRKRVVSIAAFVVLCSFLCLFIVPAAGQAGQSTEDYYTENMLQSLGSIVTAKEVNAARSILLGRESYNISSDGTVTPDDDEDTSTWGIKAHNMLTNGPQITALIHAMQLLGIVFIGAYTLMELIREMQRDNADIDTILDILVKVAVGGTLVANAIPLMNAVDQFGGAICDIIADTIVNTSLDPSVFDQVAQDSGLSESIRDQFSRGFWHEMTDWILTHLVRIIYNIACLALVAMTKIISYSLLIEISIRRVFLPVAVANFCGNGLNCPGVKWLKKYFACYLRVAIILSVVFMSALACNSVFTLTYHVEQGSVEYGNASGMGWYSYHYNPDGETIVADYSAGDIFTFVMHVIAVNLAAKIFLGHTASYANEVMGA